MEGKRTPSSNHTIKIPDILTVLRKKLILILCCGILTGGLGFGYYHYYVTPVYRASATMMVDTRSNTSANITSEQVALARRLVQSICIMMKNNAVLEPVIQQTGVHETAGSLSSKLTVSPVDETQLLTIELKHEDPQVALTIIQAIVDTAPGVINDLMSSGYIVEVGHPTVSGRPVYPNVTQKTIQFYFVGAFLAAAFFVVRQLFDNKFKSVNDIESTLDLPVLGVIPLTNRLSKRRGFSFKKKEDH